MKKKEFKTKLRLGKKVISHLDISKIQGGTDPVPVGSDPQPLNTKGDACTLIATCKCSMQCPTTTRIKENCNTDQCSH